MIFRTIAVLEQRFGRGCWLVVGYGIAEVATDVGVDTNDLDKIRFPYAVSQRAAIAGINLCVLIAFVFVELGFSYYNFPTPPAMLLVAALAILFRLMELYLSRGLQQLSPRSTRVRAIISIIWGLSLPFVLAAATRQFHTHYFGLLVLPVLETSLYFSLLATLSVAATGSCLGMLWVAYAGNFRSPFQLGEMIETATLVLMLFIVGTVVWLLLDLLVQREIELKERLVDLESTRGKLLEEEKLAAIGRLASAMAHEIRNPVAIISSAIEAAGSSEFSIEEREEMSKVAMIESRRLEKLTTDFLRYAQPTTFHCEQVDAVALVGSMSSIARAHALGKRVKIDITIQQACHIFGNEDQLQQALLNLLRNAIDASPEFGHVSVGLVQVGEQIKITIGNEGVPIPEEIVDRIFEPFFTAKRGGTGLGLSIARKIADAHHGSLKLECNREASIRFALLLPSHPAGTASGKGGVPWHVS